MGQFLPSTFLNIFLKHKIWTSICFLNYCKNIRFGPPGLCLTQLFFLPWRLLPPRPPLGRVCGDLTSNTLSVVFGNLCLASTGLGRYPIFVRFEISKGTQTKSCLGTFFGLRYKHICKTCVFLRRWFCVMNTPCLG